MGHTYRHKHTFLLAILSVAILFCLTLSSCSGRKIGATEGGYFAGGRADLAISVTGEQKLAATGTRTLRVPSDTMLPVNARMHYAVFTYDDSTSAPARHTHVLIGELPRTSWRWEMETWGLPETISYEKVRKSGKDWTEQIYPVVASEDWFSRLYEANGRPVPEFWLAKRWSSTPETNIRVVAEYREPAPECIVPALKALQAQEKGTNKSNANRLWKNCTEIIFAFSGRADGYVQLDRYQQNPEAPIEIMTNLPDSDPDAVKLVGRAQKLDRNGSNQFKD